MIYSALSATAAAFLVLATPIAAGAQGLLPEDPAVLAALPRAPLHRAWLPPAVDLSAGFPPPGDQGHSSTCAGWAVGYALRSYIEHETTGADMSQPGNRFNPLFIYNRVAQTCAAGARITDAVAFLSRVGALPFREMSSAACPDGAGPEVMARAAAWRIGSYHVVSTQRLDDVKGELAQRRPVVIGIRITTGLQHLGPGDVYAEPEGSDLGGHAVVVVGYDDARQAFKVMNSWGRGWGDGGFGWISYPVFARDTQVALSADLPPATRPIETQPPPAPAPPPPPAPAPPAVIARPPPAPVTEPGAKIRVLAVTLSCARLDVSPDGRVDGFVGSETDLRRVRAAAGETASAGVALRPWPQCEALLTLERPIARAGGLSLALDPPGQPCPDGTLCGGDAVVATVHMPRRSAYLYLAYIQAAGDTLILEQPQAELPTPRKPGEVIVLGRGDSALAMRIDPPLGREMMIALAAASPLFDTKLPDTMTEREFLTMLRKALLYKRQPADPDRQVGAAVLPIVTSAR